MPEVTDSLRATEAECAVGRTAPRVSLDDILASISAEYTFTAAQAISGLDMPAAASPLDVLTIHLIVMTNGFTIIGKSAPASPENFDAQLGAKLAKEDAIRQIWPLMGFALREQLLHAGVAMAAQEAPPVGAPLVQLYLSDAQEISAVLLKAAGPDAEQDSTAIDGARDILEAAIADRLSTPDDAEVEKA